jgi:hypothetical protein
MSIPGQTAFEEHYWKMLRRQVRVELVIRGVERRRVIQVYEYFWTGGASGDWNFTTDDERALFLVRHENGKYHVVRDWWRSIYPVTGPHKRLPLDDSHDTWERIALMNWWVPRHSADRTLEAFGRSDPGGSLNLWRVVKLDRGLFRHPNQKIRLAACRSLIETGWGQDECWDTLSDSDRAHLTEPGRFCCKAADIAEHRRKDAKWGAKWLWDHYHHRDLHRLHTANSNLTLRREFCRMYQREYPGDTDNGCPADRSPPATIVTEQGDVPLIGDWPDPQDR